MGLLFDWHDSEDNRLQNSMSGWRGKSARLPEENQTGVARELNDGLTALAKLREVIIKQKKTIGLQHRCGSHPLSQPSSWWVISAEAELTMLQARRGVESWQAAIARFIHQHTVQLILITLLVIDVVVLFVELYLDAEFPRCDIVRRDAISCCDATSVHMQNISVSHRLLGSLPHHDFCEYGGHVHTNGRQADCDPHKHDAVHFLHEILFGTSVGILAIFAIELLLLLFALDIQFFHNLLYVVDALVVYISLVLEITLHTTNAGQLSGAFVLGRLWRFLRVAHGLVMATHEAGHHVEHVEEVESATNTLEALVEQLRHEKQELEQQLHAVHAYIESQPRSHQA